MHPRSARYALNATVLFVLTALLPAQAQEPKPQAPASAPPAQAQPPAPAGAPRALTGKEHLSEKWTDEQRIDNCKVPPEKRGAKPRPDACASAPTASR